MEIDDKGLKRLLARLQRYWVDDPKRLMETVREWWHGEGRLAFSTSGARVNGRGWKRLTAAWRKRKGGGPINVQSGTLRSQMSGGPGAWSSMSNTEAKVGITYDRARYNALSKWRRLAGTRPEQMAGLDKDTQREIDRFDRSL